MNKHKDAGFFYSNNFNESDIINESENDSNESTDFFVQTNDENKLYSKGQFNFVSRFK